MGCSASHVIVLSQRLGDGEGCALYYVLAEHDCDILS